MRHRAINRQFEAREGDRAGILPTRVGSRDNTRGQGEGPHHDRNGARAARHGPHLAPVKDAANSSRRCVIVDDGWPVTRRTALWTASPYHFFHAWTI